MVGVRSEQRVRDPNDGLPSRLSWIGLCAAAETVGMAASALAAKAGLLPGVTAPAAFSLVVAGGVLGGTALGAAQATGLRRVLDPPGRRAWLLVTLLVAGIGWAAASVPSVPSSGDGGEADPPAALVVLGGAGLGAVMGAVLGGAQALVLRGRVRHPWRWVEADAVAWAPAMAVVVVGASLPSATWPVIAYAAVGAATGLVAGAVLGVVSGWFLPSLTGLSPRDRVVLAVLRSTAHAALDRSLVGLGLRGRRTGRSVELPVRFAAGPDGIVVVPGRSATKAWWRNLDPPAPVVVVQEGCWWTGRAELLRDGESGYGAALATYRRRWPRVRVAEGDPLVRVRPRR